MSTDFDSRILRIQYSRHTNTAVIVFKLTWAHSMRSREHQIARQSSRRGAQRSARRAAGRHAARDDNRSRCDLRGAVCRMATAIPTQCVQSVAIARLATLSLLRRAHCCLRRTSDPTLELLRVLYQVGF